jgi:uncharacterized protein YaaQ
MKMIMCVVDDMDTFSLLDALSEKGIQATKLASSGGFLRRGNTTLLIGVDDDKKDEVLDIVRKVCMPRKQMVPMSPMMSMEDNINPVDVMVSMGGATTFVLDVVEHYKL